MPFPDDCVPVQETPQGAITQKNAHVCILDCGPNTNSKTFTTRTAVVLDVLSLSEKAEGLSISAVRLNPNIPIVHQLNLPLDHLLAVLGMFHGDAVEVEVLGVDGVFIQDLIELRAEVLHPVVPLGPRAVIAERFDINHAGYIG